MGKHLKHLVGKRSAHFCCVQLDPYESEQVPAAMQSKPVSQQNDVSSLKQNITEKCFCEADAICYVQEMNSGANICK